MPEVTIDTLTLGLVWFVVFLFSTTCHEAAHALVARRGGDTTAANQVTLNPTPHVQREPFGMVVVPLVSYLLGGWMIGWASAPYNPEWAYRYPHRAARMALAGPAANFALMLIGALIIRIGLAVEWFQPPASVHYTRITEAVDPSGVGSLIAVFASVLFILNLLLGTFNLLPVPPLDGNAGITIFMSESRARNFMSLFHQQGFGMMGILLAWVVFGRIFDVVFTVALNVLYFPIVSYG
ncbi:MAG TPA: site-2 protease family protein [Vicinamibacteria bacterium]|nr:site-2 protease family protein [Vicinamibacteria bacterium]